VDFLRTRTLTVFAWESLPGFVADLPNILLHAASIGCVEVLEELVDNGSARSHYMHARLLRGRGAWARWPGSALTAAHGTATPAPLLPREGTSRYYGTHTSTAARETSTPATALLREGNSRCCGTRTSRAARGKAQPDTLLPKGGTSRGCGTRTCMAASGIRVPATVRRSEGTLMCYSTRTSTAARCDRALLLMLWRMGMPRWWSTCARQGWPHKQLPSSRATRAFGVSFRSFLWFYCAAMQELLLRVPLKKKKKKKKKTLEPGGALER